MTRIEKEICGVRQEFFHHDERLRALIGERSGTVLTLGDTVTVRLQEAVPLTGGMRFELISNDKSGIDSRSRRQKIHKGSVKRQKRQKRRR